MTKEQVRGLAAAEGIPTAAKRSSAGICFIGRRDFGAFLEQYTPPMPGQYIDVDSGTYRGRCANMLALTHGQRAGLGGCEVPMYVVGKNLRSRVVYVAAGRDHPAMLANAALLRPATWIAGAPPAALAAGGGLVCSYKARYRQLARRCTVTRLPDSKIAGQGREGELRRLVSGVTSSGSGSGGRSPGFGISRFCVLQAEDMIPGPGALVTKLDEPAWALTPQQAFAMYDGEVCLGSALLALPGESVYEQQEAAAVRARAGLAARRARQRLRYPLAGARMRRAA